MAKVKNHFHFQQHKCAFVSFNDSFAIYLFGKRIRNTVQRFYIFHFAHRDQLRYNHPRVCQIFCYGSGYLRQNQLVAASPFLLCLCDIEWGSEVRVLFREYSVFNCNFAFSKYVY